MHDAEEWAVDWTFSDGFLHHWFCGARKISLLYPYSAYIFWTGFGFSHIFASKFLLGRCHSPVCTCMESIRNRIGVMGLGRRQTLYQAYTDAAVVLGLKSDLGPLRGAGEILIIGIVQSYVLISSPTRDDTRASVGTILDARDYRID